MQLDLLYKGLPSAKADTRKFGVQIHSNAISFIQHEGGGGGRGRGLYTRPPPSASPPAPALGTPPAPSVGSPSHLAPRRRMGAKKWGRKRKRRRWAWCFPAQRGGGSAGTPPPRVPSPLLGCTKRGPVPVKGFRWGSGGPQTPGSGPVPHLAQLFQDKNLDLGLFLARDGHVNKAKKPFGLMQLGLPSRQHPSPCPWAPFPTPALPILAILRQKKK